MATDTVTQAEREVARFLTRQPSAEEIINFRPSTAVAARANDLIASERAGQLSDDERHELDSYLYIEHLMRLLKVEARRRLGDQNVRPQ